MKQLIWARRPHPHVIAFIWPSFMSGRMRDGPTMSWDEMFSWTSPRKSTMHAVRSCGVVSRWSWMLGAAGWRILILPDQRCQEASAPHPTRLFSSGAFATGNERYSLEAVEENERFPPSFALTHFQWDWKRRTPMFRRALVSVSPPPPSKKKQETLRF